MEARNYELIQSISNLTRANEKQKDNISSLEVNLEKEKGKECFRREIDFSDRATKLHEIPIDLIQLKANSTEIDFEETKKTLCNGDDLKRNALYGAKINILTKKGTKISDLKKNPAATVPLLISSRNRDKRIEVQSTFKDSFNQGSHFSPILYTFTRSIRNSLKDGKLKLKNNTDNFKVSSDTQILIRPNKDLSALNISARNNASDKWTFISNATCEIHTNKYANPAFSNLVSA